MILNRFAKNFQTENSINQKVNQSIFAGSNGQSQNMTGDKIKENIRLFMDRAIME